MTALEPSASAPNSLRFTKPSWYLVATEDKMIPPDARSRLTPARWLDTGRSLNRSRPGLVGSQAANGPSCRIARQYPQGQASVTLCMPHGQREPFSRHRGY